MSAYRFLQDAYIGDRYYEAGTIYSTADVGGTLPIGWEPNGNVEPLDGDAVTAFYNAGPSPPQWKLTGLGASKAPICE
jgi:hypothetical protein